MLTTRENSAADPVQAPDLLNSEPAAFVLSGPARGLLYHLRTVPGVAKVIDNLPVIDLRVRGSSEDEAPLLPLAVSIEVNPADPDGLEQFFEPLEQDQQCIVLRNVLQYLPDYRRFVGAAFGKLAVGGYLIITVPHQFLAERKLVLPSRIDRDHLRFYTPASLMDEIEESIDPLQYRVRLLLDNDLGYDYTAALGARPNGGKDIVACLQRIEAPAWSCDLESQQRPVEAPTRPPRYPPPGDRESVRNLIIEPDDRPIKRILVLKLDHRGDFLMAQDAFTLLRRNFPNSSITLVCGGWNKARAGEMGLFDHIIPFDFFPEDTSSGIGWVPFDENAATFKQMIGDSTYDLAVDLRLYEDTRELLRSANARFTAGLDPSQSFRWLTIPLTLPIGTRHGRAADEFVGAAAFSARIGEHRRFEIAFEDRQNGRKSEYLIWGPYVDLGAGTFEFELLIEAMDGGELLFDLAAEKGQQIVAGGVLKLRPNEFPRIGVTARRALHAFECRLMAAADGPLPKFRFRGLRYVRQGLLIGVHQEEAMALLVHLIQLRLKYPYAATTER